MIHCCHHANAETRAHDIPGSAPGRWVQCQRGELGATESGDVPGSWVRWQVTGPAQTFTTQRHELPPGAAERISEVTSRLGPLPRDEGIVHWLIEDGHLVIRPALDIDLGIEVHFDEASP